MPAGDLLDGDWQAEIRGTLTGAGTDWEIAEGGIAGLGVPPAKTADVDRQHGDGIYRGRDYAGPRNIFIPYMITLATAAEAGAAFVELCELWATSETDIELHLQIPGFGHISFTGRPRGLAEKVDLLHTGYVEALATFACDPAVTFEDGS